MQITQAFNILGVTTYKHLNCADLADFRAQAPVPTQAGHPDDKPLKLSKCFIPAHVTAWDADVELSSEWSVFVLDFDDVSLEQVRAAARGWRHWIYTTYSHTAGPTGRYRLILEPSRPFNQVENHLIRRYMRSELQLPFDLKTSSRKQLFTYAWLPADSSEHIDEYAEGDTLDIDALWELAFAWNTELNEGLVEPDGSTVTRTTLALGPERVGVIRDLIAEASDDLQGQRNDAVMYIASYLLRVAPAYEQAWLEAFQSWPPEHARAAESKWEKWQEDVQTGKAAGRPAMEALADCSEAVGAILQELDTARQEARDTQAERDKAAAVLVGVASAAPPTINPAAIDPEEQGWRESQADVFTFLKRDKDNILHHTLNTELIFRHHLKWRNRISYNELSKCPELDGKPYEGDGTDLANELARDWADGYNYLPRSHDALKGFLEAAKYNRYNPLKDWLRGLEWDGTSRLDDWLIRTTGCEDTELNRAFGRWFILGMVMRGMHNGVKFDYMLVLGGPQGMNKSSLFRTLASPEYFTDGLLKLQGTKEHLEVLRGMWLVEAGEMSAVQVSRVEASKQFITSVVDDYRPPYAHTRQRFPREYVLCGTVNTAEYLLDNTGNRRYWVVDIKQLADLKWLRENREQIFAEAMVYYREEYAKHQAALDKEIPDYSVVLPEHLWAAQESKASEKVSEHPWEANIRKFIDKKSLAHNNKDRRFQTVDVLQELMIPVDRRDWRASNQVNNILRKLGCEQRKSGVWYWYPKEGLHVVGGTEFSGSDYEDFEEELNRRSV